MVPRFVARCDMGQGLHASREEACFLWLHMSQAFRGPELQERYEAEWRLLCDTALHGAAAQRCARGAGVASSWAAREDPAERRHGGAVQVMFAISPQAGGGGLSVSLDSWPQVLV